MKKLILLLVTAIALGSVDGYSATPRRSGSHKSTTTASSKKSSAASPIAGLEKALANTTPRDATSLATLEKNLAWAENIRVKYAEPLTAPQKLPNGKYRYSGNMESLMYEIKKYTSVNESLQEHIGKQNSYNSNRMANAEGSQIMLDYSEFLSLQHINHILGMLPDESKTPFKEAMVKMYLAKGAFLELVDASQWGASPSFAIATYYPAITEGMNEMLFKIWDIVKNDVSAGYNTADQTLQALCNSFSTSDDNRVSTDEFVGLKSKFETAGSDFINAYKAWLEKYPGHNATLANADAILFKQWGIAIDEDTFNSALDDAVSANQFYSSSACSQEPYYRDGDLEPAIANAMSPDMIEKAGRLGGIIQIKLFITKDGVVKDAEIIQGVSDDVDADFIRAAKSLKGFIPGRINGKAVNTIMELMPLRF